MTLLPVYDQQGRPGMVLRVLEHQTPGSTAFEVLDDPEPGR